ncbi:hypothetical protein C0J50_16136 [Silurus asotus]|uniref:Uncharacterized protein n=1 Tax=Silurus asotus TaxID=30991 RepID=A0AAD5FQE5_SILAS|nr:hypothetical protein C0J50_16136 [Silurus asotus]
MTVKFRTGPVYPPEKLQVFIELEEQKKEEKENRERERVRKRERFHKVLKAIGHRTGFSLQDSEARVAFGTPRTTRYSGAVCQTYVTSNVSVADLCTFALCSYLLSVMKSQTWEHTQSEQHQLHH